MAQRLRPFHPFKSEVARDRYLAFYDSRAENQVLPWEVFTVDTERGKTLVRVAGPQDAAPLVLLPPRGGNSLDWGDMAAVFSKHFRTYAIDSIYDVGRSVNAGPASSVEDYPLWLDQLFDTLGLADGVNMLGLSRGAWMAAECLVYAPDRFHKVVWLSPGALLLPYSPLLMARSLLSVPMLLAPSRFTCDLGTRWMMPDAASSTGNARELYVGFLDGLAITMCCFDVKALDFFRMERVLTDGELAGISVPVLYLAGEREKMYSATAGAARLASVAPQVETCIIPEGGHDLVMLQPDLVAEKVLEFLSR